MELPIKDICAYKHIKRPYLNYALIGVLIAVFIYQIMILKDNTILYMLNWNLVLAGEWWRIITHMFLHADWWVWFIPIHLVSNLYFIHLFSDNVEDAFAKNNYSRFLFIVFFLLSGIIAGTIFGISQPDVYALGASGAISGVLGMYCILYPYAQIDVLSLKVIPVQKWEDLQEIWNSKIIYTVSAYYYLMGWFGLQIVSWWYMSGESVAYLAHIAGFVFGIGIGLTYKLILKEEVSSEFIQKLIASIKDILRKIWKNEN